jgi:hypothetical protein
MQYTTSVDGISLSVNTDTPTPTLTLSHDASGSVIKLTARQAGLITLLRRSLSDILDASKRGKVEGGDA